MSPNRAVEAREITYAWYPPAYDAMCTTNKRFFQPYDKNLYHLPKKYTNPEIIELKSGHNNLTIKTKSTHATSFGLHISAAPIFKKDSSVPHINCVWKTYSGNTPITKQAPVTSVDTKSAYIDGPNVHAYNNSLTYLNESGQPVINAKTFVPPVNPTPISSKLSPSNTNHNPICHQRIEFGVLNKLSPFNDNITNPITYPAFYKQSTKISLYEYNPKKSTEVLKRPDTAPDSKTSDNHKFLAQEKRPATSLGIPKLRALSDSSKNLCKSAPTVSQKSSKPKTSISQRVLSAPPHINLHVNTENEKIHPAGKTQKGQRHVLVHESKDLSYDDAVRKYGWRAQIPGDPYNVVSLDIRPCLTSDCSEPEVPPDPPVARRINFDTYFVNTIPNRPKTFVVHPEWASEQLLARRIELQERSQRYQNKKFAFAY